MQVVSHQPDWIHENSSACRELAAYVRGNDGSQKLEWNLVSQVSKQKQVWMELPKQHTTTPCYVKGRIARHSLEKAEQQKCFSLGLGSQDKFFFTQSVVQEFLPVVAL